MAGGPILWIEPAKVYPAAAGAGHWIVEAPDQTPLPGGQLARELTGHGTAILALRYAYERYGRARFFSS